LAYILACIPLGYSSLMIGLLGRCDSANCLPLSIYYLIFPGLIVLLIGIGALAARWAIKDHD
jgi:hypothetical protein